MLGMGIDVTRVGRVFQWSPKRLFVGDEEGTWAQIVSPEYSPELDFLDGAEGTLAILEIEE